MSLWTHSICEACWDIKCIIEEGGKREPIRMVPEFVVKGPCCWCGQDHESGIFVRHDPRELHYCHQGKDHA